MQEHLHRRMYIHEYAYMYYIEMKSSCSMFIFVLYDHHLKCASLKAKEGK